ncbi:MULTISPECIES: sigma-54-dependent Fis family transcriptional regulator [unclassified Fusibacter]|uniref:sigma-54 interaction domain-containing protein n=1 Tax=unclassified Fusibacter TaxID=2624464 RepID=UPI0010110E45|nr:MULTISPECIES: sigma 54-interacting transcriptional regulator [unclassified Fusibacter]MCK8059024.1 sigma 54-interacting transcriptional regulator [Fusibacter sp. A2]NPE22435.1 sigma 54-interacting transcriptional regulator [Fusibacter sp. A1]RXV60540.1 PAS domain S-box protein [Fusibacter sp. A1]
MSRKLLEEAFIELIEHIDEGVHIIDASGVTRVYNKAMEDIEGMKASQVIGKHITKAYDGWTEENSTLLTVLKTGKSLHRPNQKYLNLMGKPIATVNTSMPLFHEGEIIGALEVSQNITEVSELSEQIIQLRQQIMDPAKAKDHPNYKEKHYTFDMLIGQNKNYLNAIKIAKRAAKTSSSIMIVGETGTGKELFSQSIHYESDRKTFPFLAINCAAMPESLLESILFGTTKGSFTGAMDRPGLFEQADKGTLFLDEINSMSLNLQAKLLRVLQEGYVRRVGGLGDIPVDVRIIAATNEEPSKLIEKGEFRKDLYYRINVLAIKIPSLKERPEDIKHLVDYFIKYYNEKLSKDVWMLSEEVMNLLKQYEWRGNVRELQNFIESSLNMVQDEHVVNKEHMPDHWQEVFGSSKVKEERLTFVSDDRSLNEQIRELEIEIIKSKMNEHDSNVSRAAKSLGLSRQNLQYKLKLYGI